MKNKIILVLITSLPFTEIYSQSSSFLGLGDLPGGTFSSYANGVSYDGSIVAGNGTTENGSQAFIWTESSGMLSIGNVADNSFRESYANQISGDGRTIVGEGDSTGSGIWEDHQGFRWTDTGGMEKFGNLNSSSRYKVYAVSADGSVIAGESGKQAYRWTQDEGMVGLGYFLGLPNSRALGVSSDGSVIAGSGYTDSWDHEQAFIWTQSGGMIALGNLPNCTDGFPNSISPDGSVVAGTCWQSTNGLAFRWKENTGIVAIGNLPGKTITHPLGINENGSVIVGGAIEDRVSTAFIWDSLHGVRNLKTVLQTMYGLDLTGWDLNIAFDITPDGKVIVGQGTNPSGDPEAFRVVLGTPTGISNIANDKGFEVYPNPTSGLLNISFWGSPIKPSTVKVYNTQGSLIYSETFCNTDNTVIDLTGYSKGLYLVNLINNQCSYTEKLCIH